MEQRRDGPAMRVALRALDNEMASHANALEAADVLCARLGAHLSLWIGTDGWQALLKRALAEATKAEPTLQKVVLDSAGRLRRAGPSGRDNALAAEAFAPLLSAVIDVLGRLVGNDMAIHLVELGLPEQGDV